jgi:hypothetical protein
MDLDFYFHRTQFLRGGVVEAAWSQIRPHIGPPPLERLDLVAEKHPHEVHPGEPILPQLLKVLAQEMQLAEVLLSHSIFLGRQGNGATTGKCRERSGSIVSHVKPLLPPPLHRSGLQDLVGTGCRRSTSIDQAQD